MNANLEGPPVNMATGNTASSWTLVLDSTELSADWFLRSIEYRIATMDEGITLALPAVVLLEAQANFGHRAAEELIAIRQAANRLERMGFRDIRLPESEDSYARQILDILDERKVSVLPWPTISHEEVSTRAIGRNPPFDSKGSGYRDTLVWLSALDLAREGKTVVLASKDRAFCDPATEALASPLVAEMVGLPGTVTLTRNTRNWIQTHSHLDASSVTASEAQARRELFDSYLLNWWFDETWLDPAESGLPPQCGRVLIDEVVSWSNYDHVEEARERDGSVTSTFNLEFRFAVVGETPAKLAGHAEAVWVTSASSGDLEPRIEVETQCTFVVRHNHLNWPTLDELRVRPAS